MSLRKVLSAVKAKYIKPSLKIVDVELKGSFLHVYRGTINKEDNDHAWIYLLTQHVDTMYDIGANLGSATILASLHNPSKKIVLVDPNPDVLNCAAGNLIRSNMSANKVFIPSFVYDKPGEAIKFYSVGLSAAGSMFKGHSKTLTAANNHYLVPTTTLDDIYDTTGILPGLVKIDVEGAESYVMNGAKRLAAQQETMFFIEMHAPPELSMKDNAALMLEWCRQNRYEPYYLKLHTPLTTAEEIAHRGRCHLLLLPKGMAYPAYLKGVKQGALLKDIDYLTAPQSAAV